MTFILDIFGGPTSGGHNSQIVALIFNDNHFLERETSNLQSYIYASAHLVCFRTSSVYLKPFKTKPKVFVPKTIPKIHNNFTNTHDMALRLNWLTDMIKMNIHLYN